MNNTAAILQKYLDNHNYVVLIRQVQRHYKTGEAAFLRTIIPEGMDYMKPKCLNTLRLNHRTIRLLRRVCTSLSRYERVVYSLLFIALDE
jgi:hypothetical protein